jgi:hypothetical protein
LQTSSGTWQSSTEVALHPSIVNLRQGKSVLLYRSPSKEFVLLKSTADLEPILEGCPEETVVYLNKKIGLEQRMAAALDF